MSYQTPFDLLMSTGICDPYLLVVHEYVTDFETYKLDSDDGGETMSNKAFFEIGAIDRKFFKSEWFTVRNDMYIPTDLGIRAYEHPRAQDRLLLLLL